VRKPKAELHVGEAGAGPSNPPVPGLIPGRGAKQYHALRSPLGGGLLHFGGVEIQRVRGCIAGKDESGVTGEGETVVFRRRSSRSRHKFGGYHRGQGWRAMLKS